MGLVGYVVGLLIGGATLIVVSNNDMPMWLVIIFAATMSITGFCFVRVVEWVKELVE